VTLLQRSEERLMTGEELFRRPDLNPCELVNGRVVPLSPAGAIHGKVELRLGSKLLTYADESGRGLAMSGEVGIWIRRDPDTVRGADLLFISRERYARRGTSGFLDVAPELVIEILSPTDRWSEVVEKIADYFAAGVNRVWVVDPTRRRVSSYGSSTEIRYFEIGGILTDEELLPGFGVQTSDLFRE